MSDDATVLKAIANDYELAVPVMQNVGLANTSKKGKKGSVQNLAVKASEHMGKKANCIILVEEVEEAATDAVEAMKPGNRDQQVYLLTAAIKSKILGGMATQGQLKEPKRPGDKFRYALGALTLILAASKVKKLTDFDDKNIGKWILANFSD